MNIQDIELNSIKPAKRYALALFEAAENFDLNKILNEIAFASDTICKIDDFKNFLNHPIISPNEKKELLGEIFKDFEPVVKDFLFVLIDEKRINCIDEIKDFLSDLINSKNKIINLDVILAYDPDDNMKEYIKQRLESKFQSKAIINYKKDESLLAGMQIKIKDTLIDLSTKKKLENFKRM